MVIPFQSLPDHARIWIYQSDRKLSLSEQDIISNHLQEFISGWTSHGEHVSGSFLIKYERFIILAADDQTQVSGCSIDKSVQAISTLGDKLNVNLLDRKIACLLSGDVVTYDNPSFKNAVNEGVINASTEIFNNSITTKKEIQNQWMMPAGKTWLSRYFNVVV